MSRAINWFEIPANDLTRATKFWETVLDVKLHVEESARMKLAIFPYPEGATGGGLALAAAAHRKPSSEGTIVYLNANGKLDACLARVERAGGKIALPKTDIGDPGFIAIVVDTEGNAVGLHTERT